ncbi:hypothetical protein HY045_01240 [Candidatus Woesebacteria bacterium]|nr:hypothetical protein [Candidatus Woesebacteria bacterium]
MQKEFNSTLLHESKHAIDDSKHELWRRTLHEEAIVLGLPQIALTIVYYQTVGQYFEDKPFIVFLGGLVWGMYMVNSLTYYILGKLGITLNEIERSANRFTEEYKHQPEWYSIATITPK